jgi:hypothetical protein
VNRGQTIYSQVIDFLPQNKFRQCVSRYNGNYRVRSLVSRVGPRQVLVLIGEAVLNCAIWRLKITFLTVKMSI